MHTSTKTLDYGSKGYRGTLRDELRILFSIFYSHGDLHCTVGHMDGERVHL